MYPSKKKAQPGHADSDFGFVHMLQCCDAVRHITTSPWQWLRRVRHNTTLQRHAQPQPRNSSVQGVKLKLFMLENNGQTNIHLPTNVTPNYPNMVVNNG